MSVSDFLSIRTIRSGSIAPKTYIPDGLVVLIHSTVVIILLFFWLCFFHLFWVRCAANNHIASARVPTGKYNNERNCEPQRLSQPSFARCKGVQNANTNWRVEWQAHLHPSVPLLGDFWHFSVFVQPAQNLNPFAVIKQFRLLALASRKDCLILFTWLWFSHPWKISPSRSPDVDADTPLKWNIRLNY